MQKSTKQPSLKQRRVFQKISENMATGKHEPMGKIMREAGYSESTSKKPQLITETKSWKMLIASIDDDVLLKQLMDIALDSDKRASLQAIDMLLKLKDKYPAGKLKVQEYDEELADLALESEAEESAPPSVFGQD